MSPTSEDAYPRPRLNVIIASTRPGRVGPRIADWFVKFAQEDGRFDIEVTDLAELNLPMLDEPDHPSLMRYVHEHTKRWSEIVAAADAFVFVMPEYNHGYTAPLKNALDFLHGEWQYKPVGFVSYGGVSAGLRAVQGIKPIVSALKMVPVNPSVNIHLAGAFDESGTYTPAPGTGDLAKMMLDEIGRLAKAFIPVREELASV
jgi:NAD(P)H-dependent FMN reductase